jgi:dihydrofolate reductase
MHKKVVLYIAASLDGFISGPKNNLSFLDTVEKDGQDYGYSEFIKNVDTVIMGRKTYDWVMKQVDVFPHADKDTYIITRNKKPDEGRIRFFNGNIKELIMQLKRVEGKNIFCDGGAEIVNLLLKENLIDEFIISIIPVLLGEGTRLFKDDNKLTNLKLIMTKSFDTGLVQLHYKKFD